MKKIVCIALCLCFLLPVLASCSRPPKYEEIRERFEALVTASAEINHLFFGAGLETYPRAEDPRSSTKLYVDKATGKSFHYYSFEDEAVGEILAFRPYVETKVYEDSETGHKYFYYRVVDDEYGSVIVVNSLDADLDVSLQILTSPKTGEEPYYKNTEKGQYGYLLENYSFEADPDYRYLVKESALRSNKEAPFYQNDEKSEYYYLLTDYQEPKHESYYDDTDPKGYEYVRADSKYLSINQMKDAAAQVYSTQYLESIYETLFVGTVGVTDSVSGLSARYMEYAASDGTVTLMESTESKPYITETRQFDFSTAKIVKPANGKYVTVSVETYLPSAPETRLTVRIGMILQDGVWMLDSATY